MLGPTEVGLDSFNGFRKPIEATGDLYMGNHLTFSARTKHDELYKILEDYGVSLETYQLGQLLTRAMLYPENGDLGGWYTWGGDGEKKFAFSASELDWKQKVELAVKIKDRWLEDFSENLKNEVLYGSEFVHLEKGGLFGKTTKVFESYVNLVEASEQIETGGFKLLTKGQVIREREAMAAKVKRFLEFDTKNFTRSAMIEYNEEKELFIYHPENHPYFREWLLYNYAFWSPFFKSRTVVGLEVRKLKTIRSNELVPFLSRKFKIEHWDAKNEGNQEMIKKFYNEKAIGELLDNSFFRKDRLESVYKVGLIDRDVIAFCIQSENPFQEYQRATLDKVSLEAADFLISPKNKKKTA